MKNSILAICLFLILLPFVTSCGNENQEMDASTEKPTLSLNKGDKMIGVFSDSRGKITLKISKDGDMYLVQVNITNYENSDYLGLYKDGGIELGGGGPVGDGIIRYSENNDKIYFRGDVYSRQSD